MARKKRRQPADQGRPPEVRDAEGRLLAGVSLQHDVEERRRAESEARLADAQKTAEAMTRHYPNTYERMLADQAKGDRVAVRVVYQPEQAQSQPKTVRVAYVKEDPADVIARIKRDYNGLSEKDKAVVFDWFALGCKDD